MVKMVGFALSGAVKPSVYAANRLNTQPGFSDSRGTVISYIYIVIAAAENNTLRGYCRCVLEKGAEVTKLHQGCITSAASVVNTKGGREH